jgi:hypothetical protein
MKEPPAMPATTSPRLDPDRYTLLKKQPEGHAAKAEGGHALRRPGHGK